MNRTEISATADGSIKLERQRQHANISGNAKQRKQLRKAGVEPTWNTEDRVIVRPGAAVPAKAAQWACSENLVEYPTFDTRIADENYLAAGIGKSLAEETVVDIERQLAAFAIAPAKVRRVVFVEE